MEYPKEPCPKCGKLITTHPGGMARHMTSHEEAPETPPDASNGKSNGASAQSSQKQESLTPEIKVTDPQLLKRLEAAAAAQERFKNAPQVFVEAQTGDGMLELRKIYCPESLGPHPTKHVYFGLTEKADTWSSQGYMPVIDKKTGQSVHFNELTMTWIPIPMYKAREAAKGRKAHANMLHTLEHLTNDGQKSLAKKGLSVNPEAVKNIRVEEASIEETEVVVK